MMKCPGGKPGLKRPLHRLASEQEHILNKRVTFKPYDLTVEVPEGENLLRVALQAGVHINAIGAITPVETTWPS